MTADQSTFQKAFNLHQAGDFPAAEKRYRELLALDPNNTQILHLLSILHGQQGQFDQAIVYGKKAAELEPQSATFQNTLGNIERRLGHIDSAISIYQEALKLEPDSPAINNNLGVLYYQEKQFDNAVLYYRAAITLKPDYADAYYNLSNAFTQQGKFQEAIDVLTTALQYQPDHPQIHTHLAQLLLRVGNYYQAIEHCRARLALDPNHAETHHQLAVALTHENRYEEAIEQYRETLQRKPDHAEALHNLGALYLVQRESDLALTCYLRLSKIAPDADTYYNIGVIYFYQDRHDDAIGYLLEALKLEPKSFNTHVNLGAAYLKKEELKKAAEHYDIALSIKPGDPELLYILSAISGKSSPITAPQEYVEHLFDQYAPHFDQHLKKYLDYHVPDILFDAVTRVLGVQSAELEILDLGCGTGLCGEKFRGLAKKLIGVDLSEKMLEVARAKNIYDELKKIDIHEALLKYHPIDLILAGDVLGYVGDLSQLFTLVKCSLHSKGWFAFTVEKTYEKSFVLQNNARFAHSREYIEHLAKEHGFTVECVENAVLRMQKGKKVEGDVFMLEK